MKNRRMVKESEGSKVARCSAILGVVCNDLEGENASAKEIYDGRDLHIIWLALFTL